jgi:hypothetical protein
MARHGFLERHGIVPNTIREDMFFFALPAFLIFIAGLTVSALDDWDGMLATIRGLVRYPHSLFMLPIQGMSGLALIVIGLALLLAGRSHSGGITLRLW